MSATAAAAATPATPDKPKGKSKLLVIIVAAVVVLAGAGGGAWWFLGQKKHDGAADAHAEAAPVKHTTPTYMALENMVVNLADPGGERVAQIGITLDLANDKTAEQVKTMLPSIRSSLLILISQRSSEELLKRDGKEKLSADIVVEVAQALGYEAPKKKKAKPKAKAEAEDDEEEEHPAPKAKARSDGPVNGVLFSSFIVQ